MVFKGPSQLKQFYENTAGKWWEKIGIDLGKKKEKKVMLLPSKTGGKKKTLRKALWSIPALQNCSSPEMRKEPGSWVFLCKWPHEPCVSEKKKLEKEGTRTCLQRKACLCC